MRRTAFVLWLLLAPAMRPAAEPWPLNDDVALAERAERVVVGHLDRTLESDTPDAPARGAFVVREWLKGSPEPGESWVTIVLPGGRRTEPEGEAGGAGLAIVPGAEHLLFLSLDEAADAWRLEDAEQGLRDPEDGEAVRTAIRIADHPRRFAEAEDVALREAAATVLGRRAMARDVPLLARLLRDSEPDVPYALIDALSEARIDGPIRDLLEREALQHPDEEFRARLAEALCSRSGASVEFFLQALQDAGNDFRARLVGEFEYPMPNDPSYGQIVPALIGAMRNPHEEDGLGPVAELAGALWEITGEDHGAFRHGGDGSRSYESEVLDLYPEELVDRWEKWWRDVALAASADPSFLSGEGRALAEEWIAQLGDPNFERRDAAQRALADLGDSVQGLLREAAGSRDAEVQYRAQALLAHAEKQRSAVRFAEQCRLPRDLRFLASLAGGDDPDLARRSRVRLAWLTGRADASADKADWVGWVRDHAGDLEWSPEQGRYVPR